MSNTFSYKSMLIKNTTSKKVLTSTKPSNKSTVNLMKKKLNKNLKTNKNIMKQQEKITINQYNGTKYIHRNGYVVVETPHIIEMSFKRPDIFPKNLRSFYDKMYNITEFGVCYGSYFKSNCYIYYRKMYNHKRKRCELELISITPSNYFHTNHLQFARFIDL